jgi:hypothetical protein
MGFCVCHRTPIKDSCPVVKSILFITNLKIYQIKRYFVICIINIQLCTHERFRAVLIVLKGIYPHKNASMVASYCYLLPPDLSLIFTLCLNIYLIQIYKIISYILIFFSNKIKHNKNYIFNKIND